MSTVFFASLTGLVWMGLTSQIAWGTFAVGAILGLVVLRIEGASAGRPIRPVRTLRLSWLATRLFVTFLWEIVVANVSQLRIVLARRIDVCPGWIQFSTDLETRTMRALLGTVISLTPGSLTYEESEGSDGRWTISLHVLDLRDEGATIERIRTRFEATMKAMERA